MAFIIFKENKLLGDGFYYGFALILLAVSLQMLRVYRDRRKKLNPGYEKKFDAGIV